MSNELTKSDPVIIFFKNKIESIEIEGFSRKVSNIQIIDMNYNTELYKVNFNFDDVVNNPNIDKRLLYIWSDALNNKMIDLFTLNDMDYKKGNDHGEIKFLDNEIIDYFTYQVSRVIIQFYPFRYLRTIRNNKLKELGI